MTFSTLLPNSDDGDMREFYIGSLKVVIYPEEDVTWCPVYTWAVSIEGDEDDLITLFAPSADCAEFCARLFCSRAAPSPRRFVAPPPPPIWMN